MQTLLLCTFVIMLGAFIQGFCGFGLALVCIPLLSLFLSVQESIPVVMIFGWLIALYPAFFMRAHIDKKIIIPMALGVLPGALGGAFLLKVVNAYIIFAAMGLSLIFSGMWMFANGNKSKTRISPGKFSSVTAGCLGGVLGSSVGGAGPVVIVYLSYFKLGMHATKATLLGYFAFQSFFSLSGFAIQGLFKLQHLYWILFIMPGFLISMASGMFLYKKLSSKNFDYQKLLHVFIVCMGILMLYKSYVSYQGIS